MKTAMKSAQKKPHFTSAQNANVPGQGDDDEMDAKSMPGYGIAHMADGGLVGTLRSFVGLPPATEPVPPTVTGGIRAADGDLVPGVGNEDTQPAMLTPGEFIFPKDSTQKIGVDKLRALKDATHTPKAQQSGTGVVRMANGGVVPNSDADMIPTDANPNPPQRTPRTAQQIMASNTTPTAPEPSALSGAIGINSYHPGWDSPPGATTLGRGITGGISNLVAQDLQPDAPRPQPGIGIAKPVVAASVATPINTAPNPVVPATPTVTASPAADVATMQTSTPSPDMTKGYGYGASISSARNNAPSTLSDSMFAAQNGQRDTTGFNNGEMAAINQGIRARGGDNSFTGTGAPADPNAPTQSELVAQKIADMNRTGDLQRQVNNLRAGVPANGPDSGNTIDDQIQQARAQGHLGTAKALTLQKSEEQFQGGINAAKMASQERINAATNERAVETATIGARGQMVPLPAKMVKDADGNIQYLPGGYLTRDPKTGEVQEHASSVTPQSTAPQSAGPLPNHVAALKAGKVTPAQFDQKYGAGAAAKILGK